MRTDFGYLEYQAHVTGLNLTLTPGTYWEAVVPVATSDANRSFNSNTFNCFNNSCVGTEINDQQYFDSPSSSASISPTPTTKAYSRGFPAAWMDMTTFRNRPA